MPSAKIRISLCNNKIVINYDQPETNKWENNFEIQIYRAKKLSVEKIKLILINCCITNKELLKIKLKKRANSFS